MGRSKPEAGETVSPNSIREIASAFQESRVLLTAFELDLFTALGEESRSASEVAGILDVNERAVDRLMNVLCTLDLLEKKEGKFSNSPSSSQFLVKGKPGFMAGLMHTADMSNAWSTLTEAVRQGRSVTAGHINDRGEAWLGAFIAAMHARAAHQAPAVAAILDLSEVSRLLDIGGGSGVFSMAFVRAREGIEATIFDLPNVVPLTRNYIEQAGLEDSIGTATGDYNTDNLGSGFDLVFLSAIIHSNSPAQNRALMQKCAAALNPQGQVVVQDFIMDDERTSPAFGTLFALNMLVGTEEGDTYTEAEVKTWMEEAGLSDTARQDTDFGTTLIIGKKSKG